MVLSQDPRPEGVIGDLVGRLANSLEQIARICVNSYRRRSYFVTGSFGHEMRSKAVIWLLTSRFAGIWSF